MFFDIQSLQDAMQVRPVEFYVKNGVATLGIKTPLVLLCDETTRPWLEAERNRLAPDIPTVYVVKPLNEYDLYSTSHSIITKNRKIKPTRDPRNTASYCIMTMMKFIAIKIASEKIPDASHYLWIDLGCGHVVDKVIESIPTILASPNPKVSCLYIHYRSHKELIDMNTEFASGGYCGIAAGMFSVESAYVNLLFTRCMMIYYEMLSHGVGYAEESVLTYMFDRYPEMFHLYYGEYYSIATNYKYVSRDYASIKQFFITPAIACGRTDLAAVCAQNILDSVDHMKLTLPAEEIAYLAEIADTVK
jgi:hypothetical protein